MRRNFLAASLVAVVLFGACGSTDPGLTARRSNAVVDLTLPVTQDTMAPPTSEPPPPNPNNAMIDFGTNKEPQAYDEFLQLALADVQDYWRVTYPQTYGAPFVELSGGIWASYPGREGNPIPAYPEGCRGDPQEAYIAEQNAFYCGYGDYMAYDDFTLVPGLVKSFGQTAVGIVFAHEFGHAIQARVANPAITDSETVFGEQQADCFAGSWTAHVARGESPTLTFTDEDIRAGLSAMVALKDPLIIGDENGAPTSIDVFEGGAHGTAFDRVGAFENGFDGGAAACKDMEINPLPLLNLKFDQNSVDIARGGNTPYDGDTTTDPVTPSLETLLVDDLTRFWTASVASFVPPQVVAYQHDGPYPECNDVDKTVFSFGVFYCPSTNQLL
ncbi:MAG: neutral zinc metallopeptidase, partial [Ilumatobacteraceae bacterium]